MVAVTDAAVTLAILLVVGGIVVGWLGGRGYQRYWDRRDARDKALDRNVAARYREGTYDDLIVDEPFAVAAPEAREIAEVLERRKPHNWEEKDG